MKIAKTTETLEPLRSGAPPITAEELDRIHADWSKWRAEWIRRRKVFITLVKSLDIPAVIDFRQLLATGNRCPAASGREEPRRGPRHRK